jgi:hypothetical protein
MDVVEGAYDGLRQRLLEQSTITGIIHASRFSRVRERQHRVVAQPIVRTRRSLAGRNNVDTDTNGAD